MGREKRKLARQHARLDIPGDPKFGVDAFAGFGLGLKMIHHPLDDHLDEIGRQSGVAAHQGSDFFVAHGVGLDIFFHQRAGAAAAVRGKDAHLADDLPGAHAAAQLRQAYGSLGDVEEPVGAIAFVEETVALLKALMAHERDWPGKALLVHSSFRVGGWWQFGLHGRRL